MFLGGRDIDRFPSAGNEQGTGGQERRGDQVQEADEGEDLSRFAVQLHFFSSEEEN